MKRALGWVGYKEAREETIEHLSHAHMMAVTLQRMRLAELQIKEATTLEDLDIGRSALLACQAEIQQLIRAAKRERGITLRPIAETEEMHRNLRDFLNHRGEADRQLRRRTGTGR